MLPSSTTCQQVWSITLPSGNRAQRGLVQGNGATLTARPAALKELRTSTFVAVKPAPPVAAGRAAGGPGSGAAGAGGAATGGLYALTSSGVLVLMRAAGRSVDKSVNLHVRAMNKALRTEWIKERQRKTGREKET